MRPDLASLLVRSGFPVVAQMLPTAVALYAIAAVVGQVLFLRRVRPLIDSPWKAPFILLVASFGALIGARVMFLLQRAFSGHDFPLQVPFQGTASFGAYAGGTLALVAAGALTRSPVRRVIDTAMSVAGLVVCVGRLSCLLTGDDFGSITHGVLSMTFPPESPAYRAQIHQGVLTAPALRSLPVHPVQLYLSAAGLFMFLITTRIWRATKNRPGLTTCAYWAIDCPLRFAFEFLRGDQVRLGLLHLTVPQYCCIVAFVPAAVGLVRLLRTSPSGR